MTAYSRVVRRHLTVKEVCNECVNRKACAEKQNENGLVVGTVVEIYKNLVRADECKLSDAAEREERQRFQREAIVGCRVLAGLLDSLCDE